MSTEVTSGPKGPLSYLFFGANEGELPEPFCEAELISPYPYDSLGQARVQLDSPSRIQRAQFVADSAFHALWHVDGVLSVKGLSRDVIEKNCATWSQRKTVSKIAYGSGVIATLGSLVAAGLALSEAIVGFAMTPVLAGGLGATFVAGVVLWRLGSVRWTAAEASLKKSEMPACDHIAKKRAEILKRSEILQTNNLYKAIESRASYSITSTERVISPEECEWLWIEAVQRQMGRFTLESPAPSAAGAKVSLFALRNPFDVMSKALFQPHEKNGPKLIDDMEPLKEVYSSLIAQVRSVRGIYDRQAATIRSNAKENRKLIQSRKDLATSAVTSMYWTKVRAEKSARDERLAFYKPNLRGLTLTEQRLALHQYENRPEVIRIKKAYDRKIKEYDNYKALAHAAVGSYFNPQLKKEDRNEAADLKANEFARNTHLSLFYPSVRSLYTWTNQTIKTERGMPLPVIPAIADPRMPELLTAQKPPEPSDSDVLSWSSVGQSLDLPSLVMGAGSLWALYQSRLSEEARGSAPPPCRTEERPVPSAPPLEDLPPSYEEVMRGRR